MPLLKYIEQYAQRRVDTLYNPQAEGIHNTREALYYQVMRERIVDLLPPVAIDEIPFAAQALKDAYIAAYDTGDWLKEVIEQIVFHIFITIMHSNVTTDYCCSMNEALGLNSENINQAFSFFDQEFPEMTDIYEDDNFSLAGAITKLNSVAQFYGMPLYEAHTGTFAMFIKKLEESLRAEFADERIPDKSGCLEVQAKLDREKQELGIA
jgi:hypothetical protein